MLGTGVMTQRNLSISHRECIGGGGAKVAPPNTFSMGNGRTSLVRNSGKQQAKLMHSNLRYHLSISYSIF